MIIIFLVPFFANPPEMRARAFVGFHHLFFRRIGKINVKTLQKLFHTMWMLQKRKRAGGREKEGEQVEGEVWKKPEKIDVCMMTEVPNLSFVLNN